MYVSCQFLLVKKAAQDWKDCVFATLLDPRFGEKMNWFGRFRDSTYRELKDSFYEMIAIEIIKDFDKKKNTDTSSSQSTSSHTSNNDRGEPPAKRLRKEAPLSLDDKLQRRINENQTTLPPSHSDARLQRLDALVQAKTEFASFLNFIKDIKVLFD